MREKPSPNKSYKKYISCFLMFLIVFTNNAFCESKAECVARAKASRDWCINTAEEAGKTYAKYVCGPICAAAFVFPPAAAACGTCGATAGSLTTAAVLGCWADYGIELLLCPPE